MIDTVSLVWGHAQGTAERRVKRPRSGRVGGADRPPLYLDFSRLIEKFGSDQGEVRAIRYGDSAPTYAHWQFGALELLYRDGRLELRSSLPKLLTGRNDAVLDERGVHDGLRELARLGAELVEHELPLRDAIPARLDYAYQWEVPSVAFVLEHLKAAFAPPRKLRTENVSPSGGLSLVWGYRSKRVIRFYDKVGELASQGEQSEHELDTLLRFEIQERRRERLRLVHEQGYTAAAVRRELADTVQALGCAAMRDFEGILASYNPDYAHRVAYAAASLYFVDHSEALAVVRRKVSRNAYYRWRRKAREAALAVGDWSPTVPPAAFESGSPLWLSEAA